MTGPAGGLAAGCWGGGFTPSYCCSVHLGPAGRPECWDGRLSFELCCAPLMHRGGWASQADVDLPARRPRDEPPFEHPQWSLGVEGSSMTAAHWQCNAEISRTGWWSGDTCRDFRRRVDEEVLRPKSRELGYLGAHHRLALRPLPYGGFLAPVDEVQTRAGLFPDDHWDADGWGLLDAGYHALLGSGSVAVDVGAGLGLRTRLLALAVGAGGVVHSFEPYRVAFQVLNANVALAGLVNVHTHQAVLSLCAPPDWGRAAPRAASGRRWLEGVGEAAEVACQSLDALGLKRVDFVHLDVGAGALLALAGSLETLRKSWPSVFLAVPEGAVRRATFALLQTALGYVCHGVLSIRPEEAFCFHANRAKMGHGPRLLEAITLWATGAAREHCGRCGEAQPLPVEAGSVVELLALAPELRERLPELAAAPRACRDIDSLCAAWAELGECAANPGFMHRACSSACGLCGNAGTGAGAGAPCRSAGCCEDQDLLCAPWAASGGCAASPRFMLALCPSACGLCRGPGPSAAVPCGDHDALCGSWAALGECVANLAFMLKLCRASCNACGPAARV